MQRVVARRRSRRVATLLVGIFSYKITLRKTLKIHDFGGFWGRSRCFRTQIACTETTENASPLCNKGLTALRNDKKPEVFDCCLGPEKWSSSSNGALTRLQRALRQVATGPSLHCRKGPVAEPGGRRGTPTRPSPRGGRTIVIHKQLRMNVLQKQQFFGRKKRTILTVAEFENLGAGRENFGKCPEKTALNSEFFIQTWRQACQPIPEQDSSASDSVKTSLFARYRFIFVPLHTHVGLRVFTRRRPVKTTHQSIVTWHQNTPTTSHTTTTGSGYAGVSRSEYRRFR